MMLKEILQRLGLIVLIDDPKEAIEYEKSEGMVTQLRIAQRGLPFGVLSVVEWVQLLIMKAWP